MKEFNLLVCGGSFDLLHKGHKAFLSEMFEHGKKVIIGLTSDSYRFPKNHEIEPYEIRQKNLENFLNTFAKGRYEILEINDLYGPVIDSRFNEAVLGVSEETRDGAYKINEERERQNLPKLLMLSVSMTEAEDKRPISSTRIREGEINREGRLYIQLAWHGKTFTLPNDLREELSKPFGTILDSVPQSINGIKTICVGDVTVRKFNEKNHGQLLSIVDFKVQRKREFNRIEDLGFGKEIEQVVVTNKHGTISAELLGSMKKIFYTTSQKVILVKGEEDLAVIPVILSAPLGFRVYYGQPNEGLVEVEITEKTKDKIFNLVNKFDLE